MGSVEAAASLFGSSDSGSDFFTAPEGANSASDSPTGTNNADDLFASHDSSGLFDTGGDVNEAASLFASQGLEDASPFDQTVTHSTQPEAYQSENAHSYGQEAQSVGDYSGADTYDNYDQGWYDEHGQWHAYEQQSTTGGTGYNSHQAPATSYSSNSVNSSYGGYDTSSSYGAPISNSSSTYGYQPASPYAPPSSCFDPYKAAAPAVQLRANPYDPSTQTSSYDPYKPAGVTSPPSYSVPASSSYEPYRPAISASRSSFTAATPAGVTQSSPYVPNGSLASPPTASQAAKPTAAPYRPPTSNAYDPPLPSVKPKKVVLPATLPALPPTPQTSKPPTAPYRPPTSNAYDPPLSVKPQRTLSPESLPAPPTTSQTSGPPAAPYRSPTSNAYDPPLPSAKPQRTLSPETLPASFTTSQSAKSPTAPYRSPSPSAYDPPLSSVKPQRTLSPETLPAPSTTSQTSEPPAAPYRSPTSNAYAPPLSSVKPKRALSPETYPTPPSNHYAPSNQYVSPRSSYDEPPKRERSMSNISSFSASSAASYDPYAPSAQSIQRQDTMPYASNSYGAPPVPAFNSFSDTSGRASMESYSPPPVTGPYAPSPSLLGTNDPLGRANVKVPIVNFGFGGKLVTCFHSPPAFETGFDVALSSRKCTDVHIRTLHKAIPESVLDISSAVYPGPLFGDPGSPASALVRTTTSTVTKNKTKKAKVLAYLDERVEELEKGLNYLSVGTADRKRADGKLILVRLLRVLVEYDGQLHASSAAENAARAALLPRLASSQEATGANAFLNAPTGASLASGTFGSVNKNEEPFAQYAVRPSALETLQDFLLRGEKRKAYHYALDEKMWAHAMVISSSVDKDSFKEVVTEFIRTELGVKAGSITNGHESLRLAYSLYSGQSSTAVQHLFPTKSLQAGPSLTLQPPTPLNHMTPLSPNFPSPAEATNIPPEILSQWQEYAAMLFSGQMGTESSSALTTLGDYLLTNDWVEAAHCCYLLSPQSSPIGGVGAPSVRMVLIGSQSPHRNVLFSADPDAFIFSEITEFALSLHTPPKGQEGFTGFPHLQAYRLIRAVQLADMGHITLAKRYCEAMTASAFRPSPYLSQLFADQLKELYSRLNGDPELDKSNSWISGKLAKPSLDGIGDWLGGTLSKFVAGEAEPSSPASSEHPLANNPAYAGTFSQFSNISSANTSRRSSPAPSFVNGATMPSSLPGRTGSAMAISSTSPYAPINRSSSAMDYGRPGLRKDASPPRILSADANKTTFNQSQSFSNAMSNYGYGRSFSESQVGNGTADHSEENGESQEAGWWSSAYGGATTATPTASSFMKVDPQETVTDSSSGFISLMDNHNSYTPSPSATTFTSSKIENLNDLDDDDELGLSTTSKKKEKPQETEDDTKVEKKEAPVKPNINPTGASSSGSWLGRWFSRPSSTTPGPVKANLGEENSFYYDKELKKWVNKKSGSEPEKPAAPPPPPSRAQTVSPSRSMPNTMSGPPPPSPLPPGRPMSAMETGPTPPPPKKTIQRIRSNLVPDEATNASAPPTPSVMSSLSAPPPTGRPKSAAKKNVRSRYVDVFQQPS